jgi:hypothetical protein
MTTITNTSSIPRITPRSSTTSSHPTTTINPNKYIFNAGDKIKFEVYSLRDGYLNIYNEDVNGKKILLLPDKKISEGRNKILAGKNIFSHRQELGEYGNSFAVGSSSYCDWYWHDKTVYYDYPTLGIVFFSGSFLVLKDIKN